MDHPTWVEIDVDALVWNIRLVREIIGEDRRILLVVKADAYGHGGIEISEVAEKNSVDMLGVATVHEAIELREAGIHLPILVLTPTLPGEAEEIVAYGISCAAADTGFVRALNALAVSRGRRAGVHIEIDTGMGRCGIGLDEALFFIDELSRLDGILLEGVFTHFANAHQGDTQFTLKQLRAFEDFLSALSSRGITPPYLHAANSGALLSCPESFLTMVRPGISVYGLLPSSHPFQDPGLKPVMSLKSRIVQVRVLPPGHGIGYGRTYVTERETKAAVVPIGYGHGLSFRQGEGSSVLIRGQHAPMVGTVSMDVSMVDVTDIEGASVGDEVVVFGAQGNQRITVEEVAARSGTIIYEVVTRISRRVPRIYVSNGQTVGFHTLNSRKKAEVLNG